MPDWKKLILPVGVGVGVTTLVGLGIYAGRGGKFPRLGHKIGTFEGETVQVPAGRGEALVMYTNQGTGAGEFVDAGRRAGELFNTEPVLTNDGQAIVNAIRSKNNLTRVVFAGHGTPRSFLDPGDAGITVGVDRLPALISEGTLARELAPRLAPSGVIITFAGCRSGADPSEPDWSSTSRLPGGAQSLAGRFRDALVRIRGDMPESEVRAKSTTGHSFGNPMGRIFLINRQLAGRPGVPVMDIVWGPGTSATDIARTWARLARGVPMIEWTLGGALPDVARAVLGGWHAV